MKGNDVINHRRAKGGMKTCDLFNGADGFIHTWNQNF